MTIEIIDDLGIVHALNVIDIAARTAISRLKPSRPAKTLIKLLLPGETILDVGCGRGRDVEFLNKRGFSCNGYDPVYRPTPSLKEHAQHNYDWALCAFVINVLPKAQREQLVKDLFDTLPPHGNAFVAARSALEIERARKANWLQHEDGYITASKTFQRGFTPDELCRIMRRAGFEQAVIHQKEPVMVSAHK